MPIRNNKQLGEAIRQARKQHKLSQAELAVNVGVRQALISDIENAITSTKLDTIIKVLAALDLDLCIEARQSNSFDPTEY